MLKKSIVSYLKMACKLLNMSDWLLNFTKIGEMLINLREIS